MPAKTRNDCRIVNDDKWCLILQFRMFGYLVGGLEHEFYFPFHIWDVILSHWRTPFFRGVGEPPTRFIFRQSSKHHHCLYGYGSIPINTIFSGMNIHLPAILMFTRGTRFWHTAISFSGILTTLLDCFYSENYAKANFWAGGMRWWRLRCLRWLRC